MIPTTMNKGHVKESSIHVHRVICTAGIFDIKSHETIVQSTDGRDTGAPVSWKLIGTNVSHIDGGLIKPAVW